MTDSDKYYKNKQIKQVKMERITEKRYFRNVCQD